MKIVPPTSYTDAYDRALNLESESKTAKKKRRRSKSSSSSESDESSDEGSNADSKEEPSKKVQALQKDLERMRKEFKSMMGASGRMEEGEIWCTDCKEKGHSKGVYPKKAMCDICQVLGHSTKECSFNMRTRSQQILFTQEQPSTSDTNNETQGNTNATSNGYQNNRQGGRGGNDNRNRIQYDSKGRPIIQCRACNQWGHFAKECSKNDTPQKLCRWCGPGDHEDANCPKQVNLINIDEEKVLVVTRNQAIQATYPDPCTEKQRLQEAQEDVEKAMKAVKDTREVVPQQSEGENNLVNQILQMEVPIRVEDLLQVVSRLRTTLLNTHATTAETKGQPTVPGGSTIDPM